MSRRRRRRKTGTGLLCMVVLMIFGSISYARAELNDQQEILLNRQEELDKEIADETERTQQIEDLNAYVQTKKFVEEMAREKFGLVYEDEIIYKSKEE